MASQCSSCLAGQAEDVPRGGQAPEHPGFVAADQAYDCQACIAWHAREYKFPTLGAANQLAWHLYLQLQDQQRAGGFGVLGLDLAVVPVAFDIYGIPKSDRPLLFEKLIIINRAVQAHEAGKRESERRSREAKKRVDV